jgi:hypothetical protein
MLHRKDKTRKGDSSKILENIAAVEQTKTKSKQRFFIIAKTLPFAVKTVYKSGPFLLFLLAVITILSGLIPTVTVYVGKLVLCNA